jgi:hypothetical protein
MSRSQSDEFQQFGWEVRSNTSSSSLTGNAYPQYLEYKRKQSPGTASLRLLSAIVSRRRASCICTREQGSRGLRPRMWRKWGPEPDGVTTTVASAPRELFPDKKTLVPAQPSALQSLRSYPAAGTQLNQSLVAQAQPETSWSPCAPCQTRARPQPSSAQLGSARSRGRPQPALRG